MERPRVFHAGCGGLLTVVKGADTPKRIVCDACSSAIIDPILEGVHEAQPKPKPVQRVAQFYNTNAFLQV